MIVYYQTAAVVLAVLSTGSSGWGRMLTGFWSLICLAMVWVEHRKAVKAAAARPQVVFTGQTLSFPVKDKR